MPEEPEVETKDLQEAIDDIREREEEEKRSSWTKYVGLSTAILAVFAAIGALQAGSLVNEALIDRVKASDTWNEYQASRQKSHLYTINGNSIADQIGTTAYVAPPVPASKTPNQYLLPEVFKSESAQRRLKDYADQIAKEDSKAKKLMKEATNLSDESEKEVGKHEKFAYSVAMIQVAIALGAVSALTKVKSVWFLSLACGAAGIVMFALGFLK